MKLSFLVLREDWSGMVPVSLDLWTSAGPVMEPRILFWGRTQIWSGNRRRLGRVTGNGQTWDLEDPGIEDSWSDDTGQHVRHRLVIVDTRQPQSVGALFWVESGPAG